MKNVPNILTVSRIFAVLIFVALASIADLAVLDDKDWVINLRLWAFILAIVAAATDLADGYLARKYQCVSDFGKLMDPLADKIFVTATMLISVEYRLMPAWIAILVLCREFMVTGLRTLAATKQVTIAADKWGKLKTSMQMAMLAIAGTAWVIDGGPEYLRNASLSLTPVANGFNFSIRLWYVWYAYLCGIVLVTFFSGLNYFIKYRGLFLSGMKRD